MELNEIYPPVNCPVMQKIIPNEVCFDICLVAEGTSPESELPIGMTLTDDIVQKCMKCKNHMD